MEVITAAVILDDLKGNSRNRAITLYRNVHWHISLYYWPVQCIGRQCCVCVQDKIGARFNLFLLES